MNPLPLSSCVNCKPNLWEVNGPSKYWYKCKKYGKIIKLILTRRNWRNESTR